MSRANPMLAGDRFDGFVKVAEAGPTGMVTIRGDLSDTGFRNAVAAASGTAMPARRGIEQDGDRALAWMSPDELLLLCPHVDAPAIVDMLVRVLRDSHHLVLDVSDARSVLTVAGIGARDVLAKLTPADMGALAPGEFRRSRLAQVPAAFWQSGDTAFTVLCFRSVAGYVLALLKNAAAPGSEVGYHQG